MKLLLTSLTGKLKDLRVLGILSLLCMQSVFITAQDCITSPVITCPPIFFGCTGDDLSPEALGFATATPGDANCPQPIITYRDTMTADAICGTGRIIKRFWQATYPNNTNPWLFAECTQVLVLTDSDAPIISNCPPDVVVGTDASCRAIVSWNQPTATDDCGLLGFTSNFGSGSAFFPGVTTVTYTATDYCGNVATCSFTVTVEDACCNDTPSLSIPNDYTGCPSSSVDPSASGMATATLIGSNCGNPTITYNDVVFNDGDCDGETLIQRTWTATNPNNTNATSSGIQWITLVDNNSPTITNCPPDITVVTNANCLAVVTWTTPFADDNCGIFSFASNYASGSSFPPGTTTVTYRAVDNCGNESTCSFNIIVIGNCCDGTPTLSIPQNFMACPGSSTNPSVTGMASASIAGTGCAEPTITYTDDVTTSGSCVTTITRAWRATNPNFPSQTTAAAQLITLRDNNSPTISNCPADISIVANSNCQAVVTWPTPTASDNCGIQSFSSNYNSGATFSSGTTTVVYTAIDNCGNQSTCSFNVTVIGSCCDGIPSIQAPQNYIGCPGGSTDPSTTGMATASLPGTGCSAPTITYTDEFLSTNDCAVSIGRTWTATNPNFTNQRSTTTQLISLEDNNSPTISNCPSDISVVSNSNCQAVVTWSIPVANDNCGIQSFSSNYASGSTFTPGTTTVVYTAIDNCGNTSTCSFDVIIIGSCCDGPPSIQLPPNYSGCPGTSSDPSVTGVALATLGDGCAIPTITHSDENISDGDCGMIIRRTWTAVNPNYTNQVSNAVQLISLQDDIAPVISNCQSDITVTSNSDCYAVVNYLIPVANDNCGIASFISDRPTGSGTRFDVGTTTITYVATDICGNQAVCSFDVTVLSNCCSDDMIVNCPADYATCPGQSIDPSVAGSATVNSSADCPATLTHYDVLVSQSDCDGSQIIDRYWVAERSQGSERDTCIQRISTVDNQAPTITSCVSNVVLSYENRTFTWQDPSVSDACATTISYSVPNGTTFPVGTTNVTITVRDLCGNSTSCQFSVTVNAQNSGSSLLVTCPGDIEIGCGSSVSGRVPFPDVSTDCVLCQEGNIPGFVYMGERNGHQYYCSRDRMTWSNAQAFCEANGGTLAIINDDSENTFLANILQTNSAYIGLSDHVTEGDYRWTDGSSLTYSKWYPQQPNNYDNSQDYVELLRNSYWNDQYNHKELEFIMEISCLRITQTEGPEFLSDVTGPTTVSFSIEDGCGNTATCSYNISQSSEVSLTCPQDRQITTNEDYEVIYYETPTFESCCSSCNHHPTTIPGFVYMGHQNGSYYYCSRDRDTWHNANQAARGIGGHLAIIDDSEENTFLANILTNTIAFIGISDHATEGEWKNVNGGVQRYFNWRSDNPNNYEGIQHYVEMEPNGRWNDNTGSYKREYIVEIPGCGSVRQTGGIASGGFFPIGSTKMSFEGSDECGNSRTCSFDVEVLSDTNVQVDYCTSNANNSNKGYIKSVQVGNLLHNSGNNGGYYNYDATCPNVEGGEKFKLSVTPGWTSNRYYAYYRIYIDFNGNGSFDDVGELVGKARSANMISGAIPVPSGTISGQTTMRIIMSLTGYQNPCDSYYYGETEDYCITISGNTSDPLKGSSSKFSDATLVELSDADDATKEFGYVSVYPNPARDNFRIAYSEDIELLNIISIDGRIVKKVSGPQGQIDVSDLTSGVYILRMIDKDGLEIIDRIVIE